MQELFTSDTRLFELNWRNSDLALPVEAWWGRESLSSGFELCIDLLSPDAFIELKRMLGQAVTLTSTVSDGSRVARSGLVRHAVKSEADGGFARYRITVVPWTWLLSRTRHNRVFQDKTVVEIIDTIFADYADQAAWQWAEEVADYLADTRPRSYCAQYRESDYAFVSRLLAEEGLGWCIEEDDSAPAGHRMRIFADSQRFDEDPLSVNANGGQGIRFHRADSQEEQDAVVAFGARRRLSVAMASVLSYDYKSKSAVSATEPTAQTHGGAHAPVLTQYDDAGLYAHADGREAARYQRLVMEAYEARYKTFVGRGTVRSFRPGTGFDLVDSPLDTLSTDPDNRRFNLLEVTHVGINNLSGATIAVIAERLAKLKPASENALDTGDVLVPASAPTVLPAEVLALAEQRGYGNAFETVRGAVPWRPALTDDTGKRLNPRPTVPGPMTAIVVGPEGNTRPNGVDELWCDALGRIKVRFLWQTGERPDDTASCWVRVVQRQAGAGMGWQWLPRIGQEVLVGFMGNDIDRPFVMGALFNGRGEGGVTPTPGGNAADPADLAVFDASTDHRPAAQGNLTGGNSPAWHGAAATSHGHAAALTGFKSKEFGGQGYSQLVLDDSDDQLRVQLKTTQHATELNLGHLIHQADNYRGSFRGTGVELRTDAWGALRGGRGVLMTTWAQGPAEPAGDVAAGIALLKQATTLSETLSQAAGTHQTVKLANAIGSTANNQSAIDTKAAPVKALATVASGMVAAKSLDQAMTDAGNKNTAVAKDSLPHLTDPAIVQTAKAGLGMIAGQNLQFANGDTTTLMSGQDTNLAVAGKTRIHSGQAIGLLAGAIRPGEGNTGISLIAAKDDIDLQAQSDELKWQSKGEMKLVSANANIDFAAAKRIVLSVAGGASITIDGSINVQCPGTITVHASSKSFSGPTSLSREMNTWPKSSFDDVFVVRNQATGEPMTNTQVEVTRGDGSVLKLVTDAQGKLPNQQSQFVEIVGLRILGKIS